MLMFRISCAFVRQRTSLQFFFCDTAIHGTAPPVAQCCTARPSITQPCTARPSITQPCTASSRIRDAAPRNSCTARIHPRQRPPHPPPGISADYYTRGHLMEAKQYPTRQIQADVCTSLCKYFHSQKQL